MDSVEEDRANVAGNIDDEAEETLSVPQLHDNRKCFNSQNNPELDETFKSQKTLNPQILNIPEPFNPPDPENNNPETLNTNILKTPFNSPDPKNNNSETLIGKAISHTHILKTAEEVLCFKRILPVDLETDTITFYRHVGLLFPNVEVGESIEFYDELKDLSWRFELVKRQSRSVSLGGPNWHSYDYEYQLDVEDVVKIMQTSNGFGIKHERVVCVPTPPITFQQVELFNGTARTLIFEQILTKKHLASTCLHLAKHNARKFARHRSGSILYFRDQESQTIRTFTFVKKRRLVGSKFEGDWTAFVHENNLLSGDHIYIHEIFDVFSAFSIEIERNQI